MNPAPTPRDDPAPAVTVVIVTRNTSALVCAAVQSVMESADTLAKEIVVVDNASTDDTADAIAKNFPEVHFIRSEKNLGFAKANNLGAGNSRAEFILLLNSDARLKPDSLQKAVDWLRSNPRSGVAGAQLLNPDGSRQNSIANFPTLATELLNKSLLRRLFPARFPGKEQRFTAPVPVETVIGAFMLIRGSLWRQLGGLDERYFFFLEETDFCLRAKKAGFAVVHLPQVEVWHHQGQSAKQVPLPARIEYWRSRYQYFELHHSPAVQRALRWGLQLKLWTNGATAALLKSAGSEKWRNAWQVNAALRQWHRHHCPPEPGLPR